MVKKDLSKIIMKKRFELVDILKEIDIPINIKEALVQNIFSTKTTINSLKKAEVILELIANLSEHSTEILKGGHVMLEDDGKLYDHLKRKRLITDRISSHHKNNKAESDASMNAGDIFKEFLIGKTKDGKTWFQLEAHSLGGVTNFIGHIIDFLKYIITGNNVGQYGLSEHVDKKPINISKRKVEIVELKTGLKSIAKKTPKVYHKPPAKNTKEKYLSKNK